nr:transcription termination/antitermination protein NusG [Microlunatus kandeliicorticis]
MTEVHTEPADVTAGAVQEHDYAHAVGAEDDAAAEPEIDLDAIRDQLRGDEGDSAAPAAQADEPERDFEIDLGSGSYSSRDTEDDVDIDLDFTSRTEPEAEEDEGGINLDFDAEPEEDEDEEDAEADTAEADALEAFRTELRSKFGDWYVVHTYSGMENRVLQNLENRVSSLNMEDFIYEIVVPTEEVTEIRNGQRKQVRRTVLPGYVLVRMDLTDESWSTVRHTPSVTGFVGHSNQPVPLSLDEVEKMLAPAVIAKVAAGKEGGTTRRKKKVEVADFAPGDSVMVVDGPFAGVHATITEINTNSQRLKALVEILGRETPVDLTFPQIQKV